MAITQLDPSQKNALRTITGDDSTNITVVHGPPGTGKSQLLVSLLFELASAGKTVLFVSQNTEALEVIGRKIDDLEKEMHVSDSQLSFKDFTLRLYQKEHRTLKYIQRQYSRLTAKDVPSYDKAALLEPVEPLHYKLSYTHLEKYENEHPHQLTMGTDELLAYYLKYVTTVMVGEPVRGLNDLDLRAIMAHIESYEDAYNTFATHNHPQNALRFISQNVPTITLNDLHNDAHHLEATFSKLEASSLNIFTVAQVTIQGLVTAILKYVELARAVDLYRIQIGEITSTSLLERLKGVASESHNILPADELLTGITVTSPIFEDPKIRAFIANNSIDSFVADITELIQYCDAISEVEDALSSLSAKELLESSLRRLDLDFSALIADLPDIAELTSEEIQLVIQSTSEWVSLSKIKKLIKKYPSVFPELLPNTMDPAQISGVINNLEALDELGQILEGTEITVALYTKILAQAKRSSPAYSPAANLSAESSFKITNLCLKIGILQGHYGIEQSETIAELKTKYRSAIGDIDYYKSVIGLNKRLYTLDSESIVNQINANIIANNALSFIEKEVAVIGQFVRVNNVGDLITKAQLIVNNYPQLAIDVDSVVQVLDLPESSLELTEEPLKSLLVLLEGLFAKEYYNENFWLVPAGSTLRLWKDSIGSLLTYNNLNELDAFLQQASFLKQLRELLGQNAHWVDEKIADETVGLGRFRERIVNDLIRAKVETLSFTERKRIETTFFDKYDLQLKTRRKAYYFAGLRNIWHYSMAGAQQIANTNGWKSAPSVMERIRNNSDLIKRTYPVVLATPKEVAKYIAPVAETFDFVLFDEASQLLPGQAIPSIYRAKKAVIVGDPHQMPPSLTADFGGNSLEDEDELEEAGDSILDMAIALQTINQHHLKVHYRSESNKLFEPSRATIYNKDGIQPIVEARSTQRTPISITDDLGEDDAANFEKIIDSILAKLSKEPKATFCVLFARADVQNAFRDFLAAGEAKYRRIFELYENNDILISTVTNCQGIEGDYTILYLNYYSPSPARMWFFNERGGAYKRLNVAITRQRKGLDLLLANPRSVWLATCDRHISGHTAQPNTLKSAQLLQSLLRNAGEAIDEAYLDRTLGDHALNIDSPLTEQLYNMLNKHYEEKLGKVVKIYCEVGWQLVIPNKDGIHDNQRNVGFRIDIGVYSLSAQAFILGIEMDGATYHSGYDKEHSDNAREQVLRAKGWEIYRIWSTNWLNDTLGEFTKLIEKIDYQLENVKQITMPDIIDDADIVTPDIEDLNDNGSVMVEPVSPKTVIEKDSNQPSLFEESDSIPTKNSKTREQEIKLDSFRSLSVVTNGSRIELKELAKIGDREPITRCQIVVPAGITDNFKMMLALGVSLPNIHKEIDTGTSRLVLKGSEDSNDLTIGLLYSDETEFGPANSFLISRFHALKLKEMLFPTSHTGTYIKRK
ncbi:DUF2075 domain-containing protein [Microbacteriaceae bacterium]|nr:DUF2075 domain-containing protein [Candidatus Saccharibacteria bacterium]